MADPGEGSGGSGRPLFLDQAEAQRAGKFFLLKTTQRTASATWSIFADLNSPLSSTMHDNTLLDFDNSSYPTQLHSLIAN